MKKLLVGILTAACAVSAVFGLSACSDGKDGINGINGKDGVNGTDGVGIKNVEINADGELVITLSNGTVKNVGNVVGADGVDGSDGIGIKEVKFDENKNLVVVFTDDSTKNLGKISYCTHNFSDWETVLEATCTSIGYGTRECEICGYVEYKFEEANGHTWDDGVAFSGEILKECTVCSATKIEKKPSFETSQIIVPVENAEISKKYEFVLQGTSHFGIDFSCVAGTSVRAVLDGTVKTIYEDNFFGDSYITIEHSAGETTTYKYIVPATGLKVGEVVKQGDIIGTVDEAIGGESEQGEHLHFEMAKGNGGKVDPTQYFNPDELKYADAEEEPELSLPDISEEEMILPIVGGVISKDYGMEWNSANGRFEAHQAVDFNYEAGTSVRAVHSGVVTLIVCDDISNENYVTITHSDGMITTYKYIVPSENLKEGDTVNQGDIIGVIAPAGGQEMGAGEHLHFELRVDGMLVDPAEYFNADD